jgi:hypothetical protein
MAEDMAHDEGLSIEETTSVVSELTELTDTTGDGGREPSVGTELPRGDLQPQDLVHPYWRHYKRCTCDECRMGEAMECTLME